MALRDFRLLPAHSLNWNDGHMAPCSRISCQNPTCSSPCIVLAHHSPVTCWHTAFSPERASGVVTRRRAYGRESTSATLSISKWTLSEGCMEPSKHRTVVVHSQHAGHAGSNITHMHRHGIIHSSCQIARQVLPFLMQEELTAEECCA